MRAQEVRGLLEAYSQVYVEPQELTEEQVWEEVETWVNSLLEEGYDLSEYTWEEMYESYIEENTNDGIGSANTSSAAAQLRQRSKNIEDRGGGWGQFTRGFTKMFGSGEQVKKIDDEDRDDRRREQTALKRAKDPNWKPTTKPTAGGGGGGGGGNPPAPRTPAAAKPTAKPAAAAQTGDKTKDMATFAKANPALAAAAAERARIRGTSQSDNPLMKDMPGKRPMTPSVQSPTLAKDLGKGSGNQSLLNNPNASKAAPPKPAAATPAATPAAPTPAATPAAKPATPVNRATGSKKPGSIVSGVDLFDIVKGYLLDEGYAETEEGAMVMMVNMSEGWRESILESCGVQLDELSHDTYRAAAKERNKRVGEDQLSGKHGDAMSGQDKLDRTKRLRAKFKKNVNESQHARENPEGHDKEEKKKYEKVRGEKTPMPPRGDKRREDFEKWYAKNVR